MSPTARPPSKVLSRTLLRMAVQYREIDEGCEEEMCLAKMMEFYEFVNFNSRMDAGHFLDLWNTTCSQSSSISLRNSTISNSSATFPGRPSISDRLHLRQIARATSILDSKCLYACQDLHHVLLLASDTLKNNVRADLDQTKATDILDSWTA
ncbi:uncharacterized protein ARMOST_11549 [Armillaria ostoyae]|uniref:Uncharacterized protein n=1 Tax=Armillaria ostoyae TaxID=47428 RepID=A0A284RHF8_ARMOS|nr:uncharacterized protein ARMOST_11549 [Armillaria ostoyae]